MIDKINRKLSVKKFQGGGINTIPQSPFTLQGMQQSISTQWPKVAQWAARNPKLATLGTAGLNTPAGRLLWGLSLASPLIKKGLKMAVAGADTVPGAVAGNGPTDVTKVRAVVDIEVRHPIESHHAVKSSAA